VTDTITPVALTIPSAAGLLPLTERVPALAAPCRRHHDEAVIEAAVQAWGASFFPAVRPATWHGARFGAMASRAFPDASKVAMVLLGAPRGHLEWLLESARYNP